jgi:NAD(P)-dependent dehydrogenase (short-subunit alcohol dehydrogenase family)
VLVNNAGVAIFKPILNITYEEWSRVLAVNLTGPFLCTQAALQALAYRRCVRNRVSNRLRVTIRWGERQR